MMTSHAQTSRTLTTKIHKISNAIFSTPCGNIGSDWPEVSCSVINGLPVNPKWCLMGNPRAGSRDSALYSPRGRPTRWWWRVLPGAVHGLGKRRRLVVVAPDPWVPTNALFMTESDRLPNKSQPLVKSSYFSFGPCCYMTINIQLQGGK